MRVDCFALVVDGHLQLVAQEEGGVVAIEVRRTCAVLRNATDSTSMNRSLPLPLLLVLMASSCVNLAGALWLVPDRGSDFLALYSSGSAWGQDNPPYEAAQSGIPNLTPPVLLPLWRLLATSFHMAFLLWTACRSAPSLRLPRTITRRAGFTAWETTLGVPGIAPAGITRPWPGRFHSSPCTHAGLGGVASRSLVTGGVLDWCALRGEAILWTEASGFLWSGDGERQ